MKNFAQTTVSIYGIIAGCFFCYFMVTGEIKAKNILSVLFSTRYEHELLTFVHKKSSSLRAAFLLCMIGD